MDFKNNTEEATEAIRVDLSGFVFDDQTGQATTIGVLEKDADRFIADVRREIRQIRRTEATDRASATLAYEKAVNDAREAQRQGDKEALLSAQERARQAVADLEAIDTRLLQLQRVQKVVQNTFNITGDTDLIAVNQISGQIQLANARSERYLRTIDSIGASLLKPIEQGTVGDVILQDRNTPDTIPDESEGLRDFGLLETAGGDISLPNPVDDPESKFNQEKNRLLLEQDREANLLRLQEQEQYVQGALALSSTLFGGQSKLTRALLLLEQALGIGKAIASAAWPANLPAILFATASFIGTFATLNRAEQSAPKFSKGGIIPIGGKRHSQGGTKFYGTDGTTFEAEAGEALILNRGATQQITPFMDKLNRYFGGNSLNYKTNYLQGGGTINPQSISIDTTGLARAIGNELRANPPVLGLQEFDRFQFNRNRVNLRANT